MLDELLFYIFNTKISCQNKLSREGIIGCICNPRVLRSDKITTTTGKKKKSFIKIEPIVPSKITNTVPPEEKMKENIQLKNDIGNYFTSSTTKKLVVEIVKKSTNV